MATTIRLVEPDSNRRGDLFTRRMEDVLHALGYEQFVRDFARPGREVDIMGIHRTEQHRVVVECKATKKPIGGDHLNKFAGVLELERRQHPEVETVGYFISLSGFTRSAIEQEATAGGGRFVAMDGESAVRELIKGHVVVPEEQATERAGRCAASFPRSIRLDPNPELLISQLGWIWVVYFTLGKDREYFALVHADGEPLAVGPAAEVIAADKAVGGSLYELTWLVPPPEPGGESETRLNEAKTAYLNYLRQDYGSITLEGLPPDQEIGVRKLKLENIFVPLHLEPRFASTSKSRKGSEAQIASAAPRQPVGDVLTEHRRLAILAAPGAGKSTLVKRLAVAYGFPERRDDAEDRLPMRPWLPLVIRCRQLGNAVNQPITEILQRIAILAEMPDLAPAFRGLVANALRSGNIMLLVDGLDEISDESQRVAFVLQLRTFLATYPAVSVVVTSREAGFRAVGSALADVCDHYRIADFGDDDIHRLTVAWYREVVSADEAALAEAQMLANTIVSNDRVLQLARNPLLLTTLLLVKRWVGQLPRGRSILYGEAIKVLLRTWNVEGHTPIELDEAEPQLAFVAYSMLDAGAQRIPLADLTALLKQARQQMPELLAYAQTTIEEFVSRIELRSSLLSMNGYEIESGQLVPVYEFRHLTFQEYLSALALVGGFYPDRNEHDTITNLLQPRFDDDAWKEVIPLTAVLAGRKAAPLVEALIRAVKEDENPTEPGGGQATANLLAECLVDEVKLAPPLAEAALELVATYTEYDPEDQIRYVSQLLAGQYATSFREIVEREFAVAMNFTEPLVLNVGLIGLYDLFGPIDDDFEVVRKPGPDGIKVACQQLFEELAVSSKFRQAQIIVVITIIFSALAEEKVDWLPEVYSSFSSFIDHTKMFFQSSWEPHQYVACEAVDTLADAGLWKTEMAHSVLGHLLSSWRYTKNTEISTQAAATIGNLSLIDRAMRPFGVLTRELEDFLRNRYNHYKEQHSQKIKGLAQPIWRADIERLRKVGRAVPVAAYYLGGPWPDDQIAELIDENSSGYTLSETDRDLLRNLGAAGQEILDRKQKLFEGPPPRLIV